MTTRRELAARYDAASIESGIYQRWLDADAFPPAPRLQPTRSGSSSSSRHPT